MEQTVQNQGPDRRTMTKKAISVAWPAMAESFFVTLAGMIDTMMVSSLGSYAVAAVGLTNQPKFIALTLFFGINIAVSALVARRKGEQRRENANEILLTALGLTVALCAVITAVFVIFTPQIMEIAGSNADTHEAAVEYFRIIMGGTFFSVLTMVINAAQRGSGNTRLSMTTNLTSSVVNVGGVLAVPAEQLCADSGDDPQTDPDDEGKHPVHLESCIQFLPGKHRDARRLPGDGVSCRTARYG